MSVKTKKSILEIIKSDEMTAYLEEILSHQTEDIKKIITAEGEERLLRELNEAKTALLNKTDDKRKLEKELEDLKTSSAYDRQRLQEQFHSIQELKEKYEENIQLSETLKQEKIEIYQEMEYLKESLEKSVGLLDRERQEKAEILIQKDAYEKRYLKIDQAYKAYQNLKITARQRIEHIFGYGNLYSFIAAAGDWNTIEGIWSFTKRRIIEEEKDGLMELVLLFEQIFEIYRLFAGNEKYEAIRPDIGSRFDSDLHSIKGIRTDGVISDVLLEGIYDTDEKKVIFKAVVKVQ